MVTFKKPDDEGHIYVYDDAVPLDGVRTFYDLPEDVVERVYRLYPQATFVDALRFALES